jgi:hypothetical protein
VAEKRVYAEDEEEYFSLMTPEACYELEKWMKYHKKCGEHKTHQHGTIQEP